MRANLVTQRKERGNLVVLLLAERARSRIDQAALEDEMGN
jgi:hypothetical protein